MPPLNARFLDCAKNFGVAYGSYRLIYGAEESANAALVSIINDSKKSFTDIADSLADIGNFLEAEAASYAAGLQSDLKNDLVNSIKDPFSNLGKIIYAQLDKETLEKIQRFFEQEGIKSSLILDSGKFLATMSLAAIKGIATINIQKKLLDELEKQVISVSNRIYDVPDVTAPIHPFKDTLYHLNRAKLNFQSVSSQLIRTGSVDYTGYEEAIKELDTANKTLFDGTFTQDFLDQSGLGNIVQLQNAQGQTQLTPRQGLSAKAFLPPVNLSLNVLVIKKTQDALGIFNANLAQATDSIQEIIDSLYMAMDVGRFLGSFIQYFVVEIKSVQQQLDKASATPVIGPSSLALQGEAYARLLANLVIAKKLKLVFDRFNKKNVNDIPALKSFRQKLKAMDLSNCHPASLELDVAISGFTTAYARRCANRSSASTLRYAGEKVKKAITKQREYLDCVSNALSALSPTSDPSALNAIAAVGAGLAAMQGAGVAIDNLKNTITGFNLKSYLLKYMIEQAECMKNSCSSTGVQTMLNKLLNEMVVVQKVVNSNRTLTSDFARQAKFASKYESSKFAQLLQQFINSIQKLTC